MARQHIEQGSRGYWVREVCWVRVVRSAVRSAVLLKRECIITAFSEVAKRERFMNYHLFVSQQDVYFPRQHS